MIQVQLKLRLRPPRERQLERWLWRLTGAWNWAVRKIEADARVGIYRSQYELKALVCGHARKIEVPADALEGTVAEAGEAWRRCFKRISKAPRLKGRRNRLNGIPFPHGRELKIKGRHLQIPRLGLVKFHVQEIPDGRISYARVVRRSSGWYAFVF